LAQSVDGIGLSAAGRVAGHFDGNVEVTGDIRLVNGDCAERFQVETGADCSPGTVMIITESGLLAPCSLPLDTRVIGVVSGAGSLKPALILDCKMGGSDAVPIALSGKVYCKVDARSVPIVTGDILTTCDTLGHAMKCEPSRSNGCVIGKALGSISGDVGLLPILVGLR
jgi:hypothetical protein